MTTTQPGVEPRRKVRLAPDARRAQIITEATRLIATSGFNAVSLADIADACEIRKPSVLHYFPTMRHLLLAILEARDEQDFLGVGRATFPDVEPAAVRDWCTAIFLNNTTRPELVRLYYILGAEALDPEHPAHDYFQRRSMTTRSALSQLLAFKADPPAAAVELLSFWQGLETEGLRDPELDVAAVWHGFADHFFT